MAIIHDTTLNPGKFMVVTDGSGAAAVTYQVPLTYRASALAGSDRGPADGAGSGHLVVRVNRILQPGGSHARGILATADHMQMPAAH
jgi:hypothetical protein